MRDTIPSNRDYKTKYCYDTKLLPLRYYTFKFMCPKMKINNKPNSTMKKLHTQTYK